MLFYFFGFLCHTKIASVIMPRRDGSIRAYRTSPTFLFTTQDDFGFLFFPTWTQAQGSGPGPATRARAQGPGPGPWARARDLRRRTNNVFCCCKRVFKPLSSPKRLKPHFSFHISHFLNIWPLAGPNIAKRGGPLQKLARADRQTHFGTFNFG